MRKDCIFLNKEDIEFAMSMTRSNNEAAKFLGISLTKYKKYSLSLCNEEGTPLYHVHKNQSGKKFPKYKASKEYKEIFLNGMLKRLSPVSQSGKLKMILIRSHILEEKCYLCGFKEKRIKDDKTPLILVKKDPELENDIDNLGLICLNCYFLLGNLVTSLKGKF